MTRIHRILPRSAGLACLAALSAAAQTRPFPQGGGYSNGLLPSNLTAADAQAAYTLWKAEYLKNDCGAGTYRVDFNPPGTTVSEGQGYGMVLTAYYGDKAEFDGLWQFAQNNFDSTGLMNWNVSCTGTPGSGSATDGDTDIGYALIVATYQWGNAYRQPALSYLQNLKSHDFTTCQGSGRAMATNGDGWDTGCQDSNTSYWMPAYYRVFAAFTGDPFWTQAANDALTLEHLNANATTGLISDEVTDTGGVGQTGAVVDYNGCRIGWRVALDYLWFGTAQAKAVTDPMTTWVDGKGISNTVDGYNTDGTPTGTWNGSDCFIGGYTAGAMTSTQPQLDRFSTYFKSLTVDNYYETSLRALYMLTLTGNFWMPGSDGGASSADAGHGSGTDAGTTVGGDAGSGGTTDAGSNVGTDSGTSFTPDAGGAVPPDAGPSATTRDSGSLTDGGPGPGAAGGCAAAGGSAGIPLLCVSLLALLLAARRSRGVTSWNACGAAVEETGERHWPVAPLPRWSRWLGP